MATPLLFLRAHLKVILTWESVPVQNLTDVIHNVINVKAWLHILDSKIPNGKIGDMTYLWFHSLYLGPARCNSDGGDLLRELG